MYVAYLCPVAFHICPKMAGSLARRRGWTTVSAWATAGPRSVLLSDFLAAGRIWGLAPMVLRGWKIGSFVLSQYLVCRFADLMAFRRPA